MSNNLSSLEIRCIGMLVWPVICYVERNIHTLTATVLIVGSVIVIVSVCMLRST